MTEKLKLAIGLGATCSGCDIAIIELGEKLLDVFKIADLVFWPTATDFKLKDLEAMNDGEIDVCLYHGAIANQDNLEMAKLLRAKSKIMISFGSCACFGGIPGLANVTTTDEIFQTAYKSTTSTTNPDSTFPQATFKNNGHDLTLPVKLDTVLPLGGVVKPDYYMPGCPPPQEFIEKAVDAIASGKLPPKGTVLASDHSLCDECERKRDVKKIDHIYRFYEIPIDPVKCILEQGVICMGPATRGGCGARCIKANMPCRGCMGPIAENGDQGLRMIAALASVSGINEESIMQESEAEELMNQVKDPLGLFYMFSLPSSMLKRSIVREAGMK